MHAALFADDAGYKNVAASGVVGYGEKPIKAVFGIGVGIDVGVGEVETVAHAKAAVFVLPGADFVIEYRRTGHEVPEDKGGVTTGPSSTRPAPSAAATNVF